MQIIHNTMYGVEELSLHLFSTELHSVKYISTSLVSSIFSVHSTAYLLTKPFLRLQFLYSKYSLKSQDL